MVASQLIWTSAVSLSRAYDVTCVSAWHVLCVN